MTRLRRRTYWRSEYGYATTTPKCTGCLEAQFGDFCQNGCAGGVDQFITSGEHKSGAACGSDHACCRTRYEGQGSGSTLRASGSFLPVERRAQTIQGLCAFYTGKMYHMFAPVR